MNKIAHKYHVVIPDSKARYNSKPTPDAAPNPMTVHQSALIRRSPRPQFKLFTISPYVPKHCAWALLDDASSWLASEPPGFPRVRAADLPMRSPLLTCCATTSKPAV